MYCFRNCLLKFMWNTDKAKVLVVDCGKEVSKNHNEMRSVKNIMKVVCNFNDSRKVKHILC